MCAFPNPDLHRELVLYNAHMCNTASTVARSPDNIYRTSKTATLPRNARLKGTKQATSRQNLTEKVRAEVEWRWWVAMQSTLYQFVRSGKNMLLTRKGRANTSLANNTQWYYKDVCASSHCLPSCYSWRYTFLIIESFIHVHLQSEHEGLEAAITEGFGKIIDGKNSLRKQS